MSVSEDLFKPACYNCNISHNQQRGNSELKIEKEETNLSSYTSLLLKKYFTAYFYFLNTSMSHHRFCDQNIYTYCKEYKQQWTCYYKQQRFKKGAGSCWPSNTWIPLCKRSPSESFSHFSLSWLRLESQRASHLVHL